VGLRGMFGGGARVDTVLSLNRVHPGGQLHGVVNVNGGRADLDINGIDLALTARVEYETDDGTKHEDVVFHKNQVAGPFRLASGAVQQVPFAYPIPWATPFNVAAGTPLAGVRVGLRTDLDIARAVDKSDIDPLEVIALPSQEAILLGASHLGFRLKESDLERGRLGASPLPFYQEVEFAASDQFRGKVKELEIKFVTDEPGLHVFLEVDKKGMFKRDALNDFFVDHASATVQDWATLLHGHLQAVLGG
jgi:sporulation-control protein spo0M